MKKMFFILLICGAVLTGCNPKVDERAARFNAEECPVCNAKGECRTCKGSGVCQFCGGDGKRITSTKNYTGEGINLIDYEEDCPFCEKSGQCYHCDGAKLCNACEGTRKVDKNWSFLTGKIYKEIEND